jgi:hypothetical protein
MERPTLLLPRDTLETSQCLLPISPRSAAKTPHLDIDGRQYVSVDARCVTRGAAAYVSVHKLVEPRRETAPAGTLRDEIVSLVRVAQRVLQIKRRSRHDAMTALRALEHPSMRQHLATAETLLRKRTEPADWRDVTLPPDAVVELAELAHHRRTLVADVMWKIFDLSSPASQRRQ